METTHSAYWAARRASYITSSFILKYFLSTLDLYYPVSLTTTTKPRKSLALQIKHRSLHISYEPYQVNNHPKPCPRSAPGIQTCFMPLIPAYKVKARLPAAFLSYSEEFFWEAITLIEPVTAVVRFD